MVFTYFCSFCAFWLSRYCPWKHHIFKFWWSITDRGLLLVLQVSKMCLFASKSFTACFYARVLGCFGVDFCTWREGEVRPPPFARAHPAVPAPRAATTILPSSGCLRIAVGNQFIADVRAYLLHLFLWSTCLFSRQYRAILNYCRFAVSFEIGMYESSNFAILFQDCFACLRGVSRISI